MTIVPDWMFFTSMLCLIAVPLTAVGSIIYSSLSRDYDMKQWEVIAVIILVALSAPAVAGILDILGII